MTTNPYGQPTVTVCHNDGRRLGGESGPDGRDSHCAARVRFATSPLIDIYEFDAWVLKSVEKDPGKLVFCPGVNPRAQVRMCFLLGAHVIMSHGSAFEETS